MAEHYIPSNPFYSATVPHSATEQYLWLRAVALHSKTSPPMVLFYFSLIITGFLQALMSMCNKIYYI